LIFKNQIGNFEKLKYATEGLGWFGERRTLYSDGKDGSWYKSFGENLVTNTACVLILSVVFNSF